MKSGYMKRTHQPKFNNLPIRDAEGSRTKKVAKRRKHEKAYGLSANAISDFEIG